MANPDAELDLRKLPIEVQDAIQHAARLGEDNALPFDPACRYCFIGTFEEVSGWVRKDDHSHHVVHLFDCAAEHCKCCGALRPYLPPAPKPASLILQDWREDLVPERRPLSAKRRFNDAFPFSD